MIGNLTTERRNVRSENIDSMTAEEFCRVMNEEDHRVADAVKEALPGIARAIDAVAAALQSGGRLIYAGAGTSGRLGVMDAVECVPTFGVSPDLVLAIMAGGGGAFTKVAEGAEDSRDLAVEDLKNINLNEHDAVVGIAASGRTPYVIAALDCASDAGALPISISCNKNAEMSKHSKIAIEVDAGPEILTGSTRLKAGTAQKMILNMLSTGVMVQLGKVYKNLMVDVIMTNEKLRDRGCRIVAEAAGVSVEEAGKRLREADGKVKTAVVMILAACGAEEAEERLRKAGGFVGKAVQET